MVRILTECIPYHDGTKCDGCGASPIHGSRYKCHSCMNFNLCQSCYVDKNFGEKNKRHNKDHVMRMMMSQLDRKATPHHDRHCNGCRSENYPGIRYSCKTCNKFNLCENCYGENRFIPSTNYMSNHMTSHEVTKHELPTSEHHSNDIWKAMSIKMQNYFGSQFGTRDWDEYNADNEVEIVIFLY
ncbi:hypothetical protein FO519_010121 [Halicephalobus sp. NKZ332]|nr:hypothetical protein FO519_010121 [Halicephalobus sp. NKZ332]